MSSLLEGFPPAVCGLTRLYPIHACETAVKLQGGESSNLPGPLPSAWERGATRLMHAEVPYSLPGIYSVGGLEGLA